MPTSQPRITVCLKAEDLQTLRILAAKRGHPSASAMVAGLIKATLTAAREGKEIP